MYYLAIYLILSLCSSVMLLCSPYLRITSLGWLISIWFIPYVGALIFLLTVIRNKSSFHSHYCHLDRSLTEAGCVQTDTMKGKINHLGIKNNFLPYSQVTDTRVLRDDEFIEELYSDIGQATKKVWLTTYIFSGAIKNELNRRLIEAHKRGVEVRLLVDRIGSGMLFPFGRVARAYLNLPFRVSIFRTSVISSLCFLEKRLHSKMVIIDGKKAYTGAHNLRDEVLSGNKDFVHNVSLKYSGSVVRQLGFVFADLWLDNTGESILDDNLLSTDEPHAGGESTGGASARIIFSEPTEQLFHYNQYLTSLFMSANERICIWMPYVIPSRTIRNALIAASQSGMDVRVLFPARSDSILVDNTHDLVIRELHDYGVSCAESQGHFDHSKIIIIDDITIVGSTNLDYRSLYRNYEANIEIFDAAFTASILSLFDQEYDKAGTVESCQVSKLRNCTNQLTSLLAGIY